MLRKNIRMRKEFLLRRAIEEKSQVTVEKRKKIKECLEEGKMIPTELKVGLLLAGPISITGRRWTWTTKNLGKDWRLLGKLV